MSSGDPLTERHPAWRSAAEHRDLAHHYMAAAVECGAHVADISQRTRTSQEEAVRLWAAANVHATLAMVALQMDAPPEPSS